MVRPRSGVLLGCLLPLLAHAKISTLEVQDDARRLFAVESFGFLVGGVHKMTVEDLKVDALALKPAPRENCGSQLVVSWPTVTVGPVQPQVEGPDGPVTGKKVNAGFIFKLSTPDSTTQMEESYNEGLCMLDQKQPGDVFVPLEETSRPHRG
jgi:hypothetical protein